jgi:hypothetical protein
MTFRSMQARDTIRRPCETSLRMLGVDQIDLYQLHVPDPAISMREAMATFAELKDEGIVRDVGVCNVSMEQPDLVRLRLAACSTSTRDGEESLTLARPNRDSALAQLDVLLELGLGEPLRVASASVVSAGILETLEPAAQVMSDAVIHQARFVVHSPHSHVVSGKP